MNLAEYVRSKAIRGACTCGKCCDAPQNPKEKQPIGHTADVVFFQVANNGANKELFEKMAKTEFAHWFDMKEHNYIEIGGDMGDQGIALMTMGLGSILGIWQLMTPKMLPLPDDLVQQMAERGMITIIAMER